MQAPVEAQPTCQPANLELDERAFLDLSTIKPALAAETC